MQIYLGIFRIYVITTLASVFAGDTKDTKKITGRNTVLKRCDILWLSNIFNNKWVDCTALLM